MYVGYILKKKTYLKSLRTSEPNDVKCTAMFQMILRESGYLVYED